MAYPTVDSPYGLKPVNLTGGQVYAGSTRIVPITTAEGTAIFFGDVVKLNSSGTLTKETATDTAASILGVFMGCSYTVASTGQKIFSQYFPAATAAADIVGYVADDPDLVFKVAIVSSGTTMGGVTRSAVGNTSALVQNAGSTATGNSKVAVLATTGTTTSLAVKIIDVVEETKNASGSYTEVLVVWNHGAHFYRVNAGV